MVSKFPCYLLSLFFYQPWVSVVILRDNTVQEKDTELVSHVAALRDGLAHSREQLNDKPEKSPEGLVIELVETEEAKEEVIISMENDLGSNNVSGVDLVGNGGSGSPEHPEEDILSVQPHPQHSQCDIPIYPDLQPTTPVIKNPNDRGWASSDGRQDRVAGGAYEENVADRGSRETAEVTESHEANDFQHTVATFPPSYNCCSSELPAQIHPQIPHYRTASHHLTPVKSKRKRPTDFVHHYRSVYRMLGTNDPVLGKKEACHKMVGKVLFCVDDQAEEMSGLEGFQFRSADMDMEVDQGTVFCNPQSGEQEAMAMDISPVDKAVGGAVENYNQQSKRKSTGKPVIS